MVTEDGVRAIARQLDRATDFKMVFGMMPTTEPVAKQEAALERAFRNLVKQVHPDLVPDEMKKLAASAFSKLQDARTAASDAIVAGNYYRVFPAGQFPVKVSKPFTLRSAAAVYKLDAEPFRSGDFSTLYRGVSEIGGDEVQVLVKIAAEPASNSWMEQEARILHRYHGPDAEPRLAAIARDVPKILDAFMVAGDGGKKFRVHVMPFNPAMVSLTEILTWFPDGLDPRDVAWLGRRVFSCVMSAAMAGVVHGAIVPDHVLVDPIKHEPMFLGWPHSVIDSKGTRRRITHVIDRWRGCYPPEVFKKEIPTRRTDIHMAGKTIMLLLGKGLDTTPKPMLEVIGRCLMSDPAKRYETGRQAFDELTRVVKDLWGVKYRPLVRPGH